MTSMIGNTLFLLGVIPQMIGATTTKAIPKYEDWKMENRFHGFRFELQGPRVQGIQYREALQAKARALHCFGWVQNQQSDRMVGEIRCKKETSPLLYQWLDRAEYPAATQDHSALYVYPDTKIRLHFTSFRILRDDYPSCFENPPHQCEPLHDRQNSSSMDTHEEL